MKLPQPTHENYTVLISNIETGQIKIPQFQREFVWTIKRSADFLDSIVKGYPIGTFIFWKTKEPLRTLREIGGINLPAPKKNESTVLVLDGQQRLTSLLAAVRGAKVLHASGREEDFSKIYINVRAKEKVKEAEDIVTTDIEDLPKGTFFRLTDLLNDNRAALTKFPKRYHKKLNEYKRRIKAYNFSIIEVSNVSLDVATDIFTRINVGGKTLTVFEIMVAKTYDKKRGFDLSEKYDELIKELKKVDYQTISNQTVLRLIAQIQKNKSNRQAILDLEKDEFIRNWPDVVDSIKQAVYFLQNVMMVPVSQLLPYLDLLVLFAYFFYKQPSKRLTSTQTKELKNLFWRCSLSGRYDAAIDSRLTQDIKRVDQILEDEAADYDWEIDFKPGDLIERGEFNPNASFTKAILCVMTFKRPWSFDSGTVIKIDNKEVKRSSGENYHRFFPKTFFRKNITDKSYTNSVFNITIVESGMDRKKIKEKPPSKYIEKFKTKNPKFIGTMRTHLIEDLSEFGILDDDYDTFINKRAEAISKEISRWIIKRKK